MPRQPASSTPDRWRQAILEYIGASPDRPLKGRLLARELGVPDARTAEFRALLREMLDQGELELGRGRTLRLPQRAASSDLVGVFRANRRGFGFLEVPGRPDLFVPLHKTHNALDGDTVAARLLSGRRGTEPAAEIVRIVSRAAVCWVGVLEQHRGQWQVVPRGKAPAPIVTIQDPTAKAARPGDLVVVEPLGEIQSRERVAGVIVERLGTPDDARAKILAVARGYNLPDEFPPEVRAAAQRAAAAFEHESFADRQDLSGLLTITIDPPDARDFDDAISIESLAAGRMRLGVHIADVSHFVKPGQPLDREARQRGNSVYFPGYVIPMLPETLSNGVCSLQPQQPRLTMSVYITYTPQGKVDHTEFARSVIRSHARLTYDQVTAALDGQRGGIAAPVFELLKTAEHLARVIRKRRIAQGMISLALPDVRIELGPDGKVADARPEDTSFSHTIIEMFMVEANEAVSRALSRAGIAHLRRIHPPPAADASERFAKLVAGLGRALPVALDRKGIQTVLEAVRDEPEEPAVQYLLLRCLAQASYSPTPEGHFALASEHYAHFTSPIRRYPDLVVHRLLDAHLRKRDEEAELSHEELVELGRHTSMTERRAQDAEREAKAALLLEFMKSHMDEPLDGIVTGVISIGAFVQVQPYMAEGLLRKENFGRDQWEFDRDATRFLGRHSGRIVALGQRVRVVVDDIDDVRQEISFSLAPGWSMGAAPKPRERAPRGKKRSERARKR